MEIYSVGNVTANNKNVHFPLLFFVHAQKGKSCKKGNNNQRQILIMPNLILGKEIWERIRSVENIICRKLDGKQ